MKRIDVIGLNGNDGLHYNPPATKRDEQIHKLKNMVIDLNTCNHCIEYSSKLNQIFKYVEEL